MSRNGSGVQTSPGASFPAVAATLIESTKFNSIINDINTSITQSIASDGQTPITANLPMGGFKHTGAAAAAGSGEYAEYAQMNTAIAVVATSVTTEVTNRNAAIVTAEQTQLYTAFTTTGTSTAYVATPSPAIATPAANARLRLKFHLASGATPTLTVGTVTAALQQYDGTGTLVAATLGINQLADVEYNGTVYVVINPLNSSNPGKNRLINGSLNIWQRGTSLVNPTRAGSFYLADRWGTNRLGDAAGATVSQNTSAPTGFRYSLALQRTAANASTASLSLFHTLETSDSIGLQGKSVVLSFYAKAGANYSGGSLAVSLLSGTGTDEFIASFTGSSTIISASQSITASWVRYYFTGVIGASATEIGLSMSWTPTGSAGADDTVYFSGIKLENGTSATNFEYIPYAEELALCQRYYETVAFISGTKVASSYNSISSPWKVTKRVTPTVTYTDNVAAAGKYSSFSSSNAATNGRTANSSGHNIDLFYILSSNADTDIMAAVYNITASSEL
jgi:hypothetical protein